MNQNPSSLLERARIFLAEKDFAKADAYCERVLDLEPTHWEAYYIKFLAVLRVSDEAMLTGVRFSFDKVPLYQKVWAYAPNHVKEKLARIDWENYERFRLEEYGKAAAIEANSKTAADYAQASGLYETIGDYKNAKERAKFCRGEWRRLASKHRRRLLTWTITLASVVLLVFSGVFGAVLFLSGDSEVPIESTENVLYEEVDGGVMLLSPEDKTVTAFSIPEKIRGKKVVAIGDEAFSGCEALQTVSIPSTVKSIGAKAFSGCSSLQTVVIAEGVESIGDEAFSGCRSLTELVLPSTLVHYGEYYFKGCYSLTKLTMPHVFTNYGKKHTEGGKFLPPNLKTLVLTKGTMGVSEDTFSTLTVEVLVLPDGMEKVPDNAFRNNKVLVEVVIPEGVTEIGASAFWDCKALEEVTFPKSLVTVRDLAFYHCSALYKAEIPENVTAIGKKAFLGCSAMGALSLPQGLSAIGDAAFMDCSELRTVTGMQATSLKTLPYGIFSGCGKLSGVAIPESVREIGNEAFLNCQSLSSVTLPANITAIGEKAFFGCVNITKILLPDSVTLLEKGAFESCSSLKDVTLPTGLTSLNADVFKGCSSLEAIEIPESVTSIGGGVFMYCKNLTDVKIPSGVTMIGSHAFEDCKSLEKLVIPKSVKTIMHFAFLGCHTLTIYCEAAYTGNTMFGYDMWNYISFAENERIPTKYGYTG